jgi:hypothetical protein
VSCGRVPQPKPSSINKGAMNGNLKDSEQPVYRMLYIASICGNLVANVPRTYRHT